MNMFKRLFFISIPALFALAGMGEPLREQKPLVDCVNTIIGASTAEAMWPGKTFPGADTPFGLVQLSPDTIIGGDNGSTALLNVRNESVRQP
jgi:putative alpha-1,2-mannosidase